MTDEIVVGQQREGQGIALQMGQQLILKNKLAGWLIVN